MADLIDREQRVIDDGLSGLSADLARIVAVNTEQEAEAAAVARRSWWAEARERLLGLFVSAHNSRVATQGSRALSRWRENGGEIDVSVNVDEDSAPERAPPPAASSLLLIQTRLDELLRAEETRAETAKGDILAASDMAGYGSGEDVRRRGPLHLAVAEEQRHSSKAIGRCLDAVGVARSDHLASVGKRDLRGREGSSAAAENSAAASSREGSGSGSGSDSGSGDGRRRRGTYFPEQDMGMFQSRLEAGAVELAAASFEPEMRLLAVGPATLPAAAEMASLPPPPETSIAQMAPPLPSEESPPGDLTRSQLDLRRTARVKAFARAMAEMLRRGSEELQKRTLQVLPPPPPLPEYCIHPPTYQVA